VDTGLILEKAYNNLMFKLKVKKLDAGATIPLSAHQGDLGCDLFALDDTRLPAQTQVKVHTGIAVEFPKGWGGIIKDRSSMASAQIYTSAGVIDEGYRGEIMILMRNENEEEYLINKGDKIAQMILVETRDWSIEEVDELNDTSRSDGGFGSTGKR